MRSIAIVGSGYVGLVTGTCFAELGNAVTCVDSDASKIERLEAGEIPFYEPSLAEMVARNVAAKRLAFTTDIARAVARARSSSSRSARRCGRRPRGPGAVRAVAREIGLALDGPKIVVSKSTVPVETGEMVSSIIREHAQRDIRQRREQSRVPARRIGGHRFPEAGPGRDRHRRPGDRARMRDLYAPLEAPIVVTDVRTSEMIKYAANAFLATKISFINEIANICELLDVDVRAVGAGSATTSASGRNSSIPGSGMAARASRRTCARSSSSLPSAITRRRCCTRSSWSTAARSSAPSEVRARAGGPEAAAS